MVKGCGNKCMKYCLFIFNLIFVAIGIALLAAGVYILVKSQDLKEVFDTPDAVAILLVIIGLSVSIIAFFGCCGALQEGKCMLVTYALVVGVLFIIELCAAVLILVYTQNVTDLARDGMVRAVRDYRPDNPGSTITEIVDNLQWNLKCCGAIEKTDWSRNIRYRNGEYPTSCCYHPLEGKRCTIQEVFPTPCANALNDFLKVFLGVIAAFVFVVAIVQMVAACFACSIAKAP